MSITAECMLTSWHVEEQNTDLLLGPGIISRLGILEIEVMCSLFPFTPTALRVLVWKP